jgi:dTDP-4-dehydrorhamnose reductase
METEQNNIMEHCVKRIIILGSNGMLGRYVHKLFSQSEKYVSASEIICITRSHFDFGQSSTTVFAYLLNLVKPSDLIINCIGMINKRDASTAENELQFFRINSVLPRLLAEATRKNNAYLIHITTDCVFDGSSIPCNNDFSSEENRSITDPHTSIDLYGISKSLGDCGIRNYSNVATIRCSIIGEESNGRSLVEWVLRNENDIIPGYTNHIWNGITCLELASFILLLQNVKTGKEFFGKETIIIGDTISKYTLVSTIVEVYELNKHTIKTEDKQSKYMQLKGNYRCNRFIKDQIINMKKFDVLDRRT